MKNLIKSLLLVSAVALCVTARAGFVNLSFDVTPATPGYVSAPDGLNFIGTLEVNTNSDTVQTGQLTLSAPLGSLAPNETFTVYDQSTTYPNNLISPNGGYQYDNQLFVTNNNPYAGSGSYVSSDILDDWGLLLIAKNGDELNIWGNGSGTYEVNGGFNGAGNGSIDIKFNSEGLTLTSVPEAGQVAASTMALLGLGCIYIRRRMVKPTV